MQSSPRRQKRRDVFAMMLAGLEALAALDITHRDTRTALGLPAPRQTPRARAERARRTSTGRGATSSSRPKGLAVELAILPADKSRAPHASKWHDRCRGATGSMMTYPDRVRQATNVPYSQTAMIMMPETFLKPRGSNPRTMSSAKCNVARRIREQGHDGQRTSRLACEGVSRRACQRPSGRRCRPGSHLRQTFCLHLAMQGAPMRGVQEFVGLRASAMTQRYSHLSPAAPTRRSGCSKTAPRCAQWRQLETPKG